MLYFVQRTEHHSDVFRHRGRTSMLYLGVETECHSVVFRIPTLSSIGFWFVSRPDGLYPLNYFAVILIFLG